jgi:hypothetical protein
VLLLPHDLHIDKPRALRHKICEALQPRLKL